MFKIFVRLIYLVFLLALISLSVQTIPSVSASGSLTAWWKLDESSGNAADSSGNRKFLSNSNVTYAAGKTNNAAVFNGTNAYFSGASPDLVDKSFSISSWLYANNLSADRVWLNVGADSSEDKALHLRLTSTGALRFGFYFDDLDTNDAIFSAGAWHQVTYTYDSTSRSRSIYVDGILKANDIANANFSGTDDLTLGSWRGDELWNGKIDDVKIYNRVLTSAEITELASGGMGPDTTVPVQPIASLNWTETRPAGNTDVYWSKAKASRDGRIMLVGGQSGARLYLSKDSGATWTEEQPNGDSDENWFTLGVSSDGRTLLAGTRGGRIYISPDQGDTWIDKQAEGDINSDWSTGALSADGRTIIAAVDNGRIYLSKDTGTTWTEIQPAGNNNKAWITTAVNDTGETLLAGVYGGRLYRSSNGGVNWDEVQPAGNNSLNWNTTSMSKNGQIMLVAIDDTVRTGRVYLSYNRGSTWSETAQDQVASKEWRVASMSDDGKIMMIGDGDGTYGRLYISQNSGFSWEETRPAGDADYFWNAGGISGDGYNLIAAAGYSSGTRRVYVAHIPRPLVEIPAPKSPS